MKLKMNELMNIFISSKIMQKRSKLYVLSMEHQENTLFLCDCYSEELSRLYTKRTHQNVSSGISNIANDCQL